MEFEKTLIGVTISLSLVAICPSGLADIPDTNEVLSPSVKKPSLMLATDYEQGLTISDYLVSEKYDGVRAYWNGKNLISRGGHIINAPSWYLNGFPSEALDGELWLGRNRFEEISAISRKKNHSESDWSKVKYLVFDMPKQRSQFSERVESLIKLIDSVALPHLRAVEQIQLRGPVQLKEHLSTVLAKGGEGVMLHHKLSYYAGKRSRYLQKLKPYEDAEAKVVAHFPGNGKYQGMMGAIEVISSDGARFKIGTGFSLQQRLLPPPINSYITFRYRGKTSRNIPRFASFLRVKESE